MVKTAEKVRDTLKDTGYNCTLINARFVKPIDEQMLEEVARQHKLLVTLEENVRNGGFGDHVLEYVNDRDFNMKVLNIALPDEYVEHGNVALTAQRGRPGRGNHREARDHRLCGRDVKKQVA